MTIRKKSIQNLLKARDYELGILYDQLEIIDIEDKLTEFSTEKNPTHIYTKAGTYEVTFTVTDDDETTSSFTETIEIIGDGGDDEGTPIIMFVAIIVIIAVIGIIALVYIIRR